MQTFAAAHAAALSTAFTTAKYAAFGAPVGAAQHATLFGSHAPAAGKADEPAVARPDKTTSQAADKSAQRTTDAPAQCAADDPAHGRPNAQGRRRCGRGFHSRPDRPTQRQAFLPALSSALYAAFAPSDDPAVAPAHKKTLVAADVDAVETTRPRAYWPTELATFFAPHTAAEQAANNTAQLYTNSPFGPAEFSTVKSPDNTAHSEAQPPTRGRPIGPPIGAANRRPHASPGRRENIRIHTTTHWPAVEPTLE